MNVTQSYCGVVGGVVFGICSWHIGSCHDLHCGKSKDAVGIGQFVESQPQRDLAMANYPKLSTSVANLSPHLLSLAEWGSGYLATNNPVSSLFSSP